MSAALTSRANLPQMWEASSRTIRKLSHGSEDSLGLRALASKLIVLGSSDAPPLRYAMIQLEHIASFLHYKFGELEVISSRCHTYMQFAEYSCKAAT